MRFLLVQTIFSYHKGSIFSLKQTPRVLEGPGKKCDFTLLAI